MKLCCPACGAMFSLDVLLANDSARGAVMAALDLPAPLGKLLIQYIALFRPAQRQLSFDRVARLLEELRGPISEGRIERNGRIFAAPHDAWKNAIAEMLALRDSSKLRLPLASHGYLYEIIASASDRAASREEAAHDSKLRGATPVGGSALARPAAVLSKPLERGVRPPDEFKDLVKSLNLNRKGTANGSSDPA